MQPPFPRETCANDVEITVGGLRVALAGSRQSFPHHDLPVERVNVFLIKFHVIINNAKAREQADLD